jgi:hypothetical protein
MLQHGARGWLPAHNVAAQRAYDRTAAAYNADAIVLPFPIGVCSVSTKYLLPCRCGRQITVEIREAGETVACPCGKSLAIPTMLEMAALEVAPDEAPSPSADAWNWPHRLLLLGSMLLAVAIAGGICLRWSRPIAPSDAIDPEALRLSASKLSPADTWRNWELLRQGLDRRVDQKFAERMSLYHIGMGLIALLALLGVALVATGVATEKKKREHKEIARHREDRMA